MKIKTKRVTLYGCEVCKTEYTSKKQCAQCEKMPIEPQEFEIGDIVSPKVQRFDAYGKAYQLIGFIVKIVTEPPDQDELMRSLPKREIAERLDVHNLIYLVNDDKKAKDGYRYYAPEIYEYTGRLKPGKHKVKVQHR